MVKYATVEFAGTKFKANVTLGRDYLNFCNYTYCIQYIMRSFPNVKEIIVCEEKYSKTPDILKSQKGARRKVQLLENKSETGDNVPLKSPLHTSTPKKK